MRPIILGIYHDPVDDSVESLEITKMSYYDTGWECVARYFPEGDDFNDGEYFKMDQLIRIDFKAFN